MPQQNNKLIFLTNEEKLRFRVEELEGRCELVQQHLYGLMGEVKNWVGGAERGREGKGEGPTEEDWQKMREIWKACWETEGEHIT